MSIHNMFLWRNKKNINTFFLADKKCLIWSYGLVIWEAQLQIRWVFFLQQKEWIVFLFSLQTYTVCTHKSTSQRRF